MKHPAHEKLKELKGTASYPKPHAGPGSPRSHQHHAADAEDLLADAHQAALGGAMVQECEIQDDEEEKYE